MIERRGFLTSLIGGIALACSPLSVFKEAPRFALRKAPVFTGEQVSEFRFMGVPVITLPDCPPGVIYFLSKEKLWNLQEVV